jgi:hypothetical protein
VQPLRSWPPCRRPALFQQVRYPPLEALEISQHQLGLDRLGVGDGIDLALYMGDVVILETAQNMNDCVDFADVGEELVAKAFALGCAANKPGDVNETQLGFGMIFADPAMAAISCRRGSGTPTFPTLGSMVQNG